MVYCLEVTAWTLSLQAAPPGETSADLKSHHWYDVRDRLSDLDVHKSMGPDGMEGWTR